MLGGLFRKPKKEEEKKQEEEPMSSGSGRTYLKAMRLRDLGDLEGVKAEVRSGNILILKVTPLALKSTDDVERAVSELCAFVEGIGGDIARLGEERVVLCPQNVRIWREKMPVANEPIPTVA